MKTMKTIQDNKMFYDEDGDIDTVKRTLYENGVNSGRIITDTKIILEGRMDYDYNTTS